MIEQDASKYTDAQHVQNLAMLVRRLARALDKLAPGNKTGEQAMDYLKRANLQGSILRNCAKG